MKVRWLAVGTFAVAACAMLASGWIVVAPGEVAVVRRLGRVLNRPWAPGLHVAWPLGIDRMTRVRTDAVRRLEIGAAGTAGPTDEPGAGEYLTGDLNLLRARAIVQYRVADPKVFVIAAAEVEPLLRRTAGASLTRALAQRGIDAALRESRSDIAREVEADLTSRIAHQQLGVAILSVSLTDTRPPSEVAPDFAAAQAAESERERKLHEAKLYETTALSAANAKALARHEQARASADRAVKLARSRAGRFLALLAESNGNRALTVRRIYLDALRQVLPKIKRKIVLTPDEPIDLSILGLP